MSDTFLNHINSFLLDGWALRNLINLDPGWQVNIADDEHVCVGTGDTIIEALNAAKFNALTSTYVGRFNFLEHKAIEKQPAWDLLARLGLQRIPAIKRRSL